jgi:hypothetical protein
METDNEIQREEVEGTVSERHVTISVEDEEEEEEQKPT